MTASTTSPGLPIRERASHLGPALRRPMVLDAAMQVWLEFGTEGLTMNAIADAAGVTKPVVYECFDSKNDVLVHLFTREEQRLVDAANAALPVNIDIDDMGSVVTAAYTAFFSAAVASPGSWRLVYEGQSSVPPELADRAAAARRDLTERIHDLVMDNMRHRPDGSREARVLAEIVVGFAESGSRLLIDQEEGVGWTPEELASFMSRRMLKGWG